MMIGQWTKSHRIFKRLAKALIRLCVCVYSFEPLLVAHTTGASPEFIVWHKVISLTLVYFCIIIGDGILLSWTGPCDTYHIV